MESKTGRIPRVKRHWEIIADNLRKAGWSWGCVSAIDSNGHTIWIADPHREDGKRFISRADDTLEIRTWAAEWDSPAQAVLH
jgi:hypothetical protein